MKKQMFIAAVVLAGLLAGAAPDGKAQDALVAHWTLDELGANGRVEDCTGHGFHAFVRATRGNPLVPGKVGPGIRFPDAGVLRVDNPPDTLARMSDFTLSLWFQPSSNCWLGRFPLFAFTDGTGNIGASACFWLVEISMGNARIRWQDGKTSGQVSTPVMQWKTGEWYHLVIVNDSKNGMTILRVNDLVGGHGPGTFSLGRLSVPVKRIEMGAGQCGYVGCGYDFIAYNYPMPIGNPRAHCLDLGSIDDVRLYNRALSLEEQLAIHDQANNGVKEPGRDEALAAFKRRLESNVLSPYAYFERNVAPKLTGWELQFKSEWLFQAGGEDLVPRIKKECAWTRELLDNSRRQASSLDWTGERKSLEEIGQTAAAPGFEDDPAKVLSLYFDIRQLKRRIMFKSPEIDFSSILCVDCDLPVGNESQARAEFRSRNGSKLLVLDDIAGTVRSRQLAPGGDNKMAAMFRCDLSFDAKRVVFCMKPKNERAYHLYEIGVDGSGFRQITTGSYSDIDPIYLPQGGLAFLSTRGEVYVNCGPWARAYVMTRCDSQGKNIYLLSPGTEAEYSPSLLDDGRILFTRWEYVDKGPQRMQSLWTMRPDGTGVSAFWGNQSVWPDHVGEARQIPGTKRILFTATAHHNYEAGIIGIVDHSAGLNYPQGLWKVTQELAWPEVGQEPVPAPGAAESYHTSGQYGSYHTPYPLSDEMFLVSAAGGGGHKLFLADVHGNRELIYQGQKNILYAQPIRPRKIPANLPDLADFPGSEKDHPTIRQGVFFSNDIFADAPPEVRQYGKFLRVVESLPKNYSIGVLHSGGKPFGAPGATVAYGANGQWCPAEGPTTGLAGPLSVKQVLGTVPIHPDGSVHFAVPPCRMLYFQVLDEHMRCVHTMRSWVSLRPGEVRGCVGCHELRNYTPQPGIRRVIRAPDSIQPPPWGARSLSYLKDIQPVFDRACGQCHTGQGEAVKTLDLTLRAPPNPGWNAVFPEPYLTLMMGKAWRPVNWAGFTQPGYLAVPNTFKTRYDTLAPLTCLSPKSRLIAEAMDKNRCGKNLKAEDLHMLIAWIDLWGLYRSDEECRDIEDPPAENFAAWAYPPKCKGAPRVRIEYSQDEYIHFEDRLK